MAKKKKSQTKILDSHMSEEWLDMHESTESDSPLFWVDLSEDTRLSELQTKLIEIETRASSYLQKPLAFLNRLRHKPS
jgi:hypothetical protein